MLIRILFLLVVVTVNCHSLFYGRLSPTSAIELIKEEWKTFKLEHGKEYTDEEDAGRLAIYMENKLFIAEHNQLYEKGLISYSVEMNEFGDLSEDEVDSQLFGELDTSDESERNSADVYMPDPSSLQNLSKSVDWREEGAVTKVKNQKKCGSCWSFSSAASLEGQHYLKTGYLIDLSEQNLIDCSEEYGNKGCNGGNTRMAFQYIKDNGGINSFRLYPYEAQMGKCRYVPRQSVATDRGYKWVDKSEVALMSAVATIGPISVSINTKGKGFRFYKTGVYYDPDCSKKKLTHAVVVVGYGITVSGKEYWIVKNSWGIKWGERGYVRMARNRGNICGIANRASYPIV